jgi:hypothetical protein
MKIDRLFAFWCVNVVVDTMQGNGQGADQNARARGRTIASFAQGDCAVFNVGFGACRVL